MRGWAVDTGLPESPGRPRHIQRHRPGHSFTKGNSQDKSVRCPEATTVPASTAASHPTCPVTSDNQVAASVSTTAGGVPRVWVVPARIWVTPKGGTRTSTDLPGAKMANSSREYRTAVARTPRGAAFGSAAHWRTAATPSSAEIFRRAIYASRILSHRPNTVRSPSQLVQ